MDIKMMSNAELKVQMKEMEFEYEALQNKMKEMIARMEILDKKYSQLRDELYKRTKGQI